MSTQTKIIIAVVVVCALGIGAYFIFFSTNSSATALSSEAAPASAAEISFLNLASQTESVTFNTAILTDPRFMALVDIHTAVIPEAQGRKDPFAATGVSSGS